MKPILTSIFLCLALFSVAQSSWSELAEMENPPAINPGVPYTPSQLVIPATGVDFYMDAVMFAAECPVSTAPVTEDFISSAFTTASSICGSFGVISNTTNDACFATGDIQPGFSLESSIMGEDYVLLTPSFSGVPSNAVGPNTFTDNTFFNFTAQVNSVALELISPFDASAIFTFSVFATDGTTLLGSMDITSNGNTPVFVGMLASEPIGRIEVTNLTDAGELFTSLSYDLCAEAAAVPTLGQWGLISLGLLMLIFGVAAAKKRVYILALSK